MAIEGSLQSVDIQDIAQLLNLSRSTGLLHIENPALKGMIVFREGDLINAEVEGMTGISAAYVLLSQSEGNFHFEIAEHNRIREITRTIHDLVLEAARRKDTIKKIRASIKHDNIIFLPLVDVRIPALCKEFTDFEVGLLGELDGQKEIKDILNRRKESAFEIFYVIYELEKRGFLKRVEVYKVLVVAELKKLFGKKTDAYIPQHLVEEWTHQSMTYSDPQYVEIHTEQQLFGQVPVVVKSGIAEGVIQIPKAIMEQFEVSPGDKVLVKPVVNPT